MASLLLIVAELALLALAQQAGGPPWTVLTALAIVLKSLTGLTTAGLARLALAFTWLAVFVVTDNRELFFCFAMTLAADLSLPFAAGACASQTSGRRPACGRLANAAAGGLIIAVFLGFRLQQQATPRVLAVEAAVAIVILAGCLIAGSLLGRQRAAESSAEAVSPTAVCWWGEWAIVVAAALAAYAGLAL